eukprot:jgi/Botrbrau1/10238/Bobra.0362s0027.1
METNEGAGVQVLAVLGGQLNLFGMPGGPSTPAWVRLARTAPVNATTIVVDSNVGNWPANGRIIIASTDFNPNMTEERRIVDVFPMSTTGQTVLTLDIPLQYMHWGEPVRTGIPGVYASQAAEVGLLTRNIIVTGKPGENPLIGGQMIVNMTQTPQFIFGVEFVNMGQQGNLGRYPVHFHLCGSIPKSYVFRSVVRNSLQRCYVVHGTHNMTLAQNIAWNVTGHCFMLEDGIERDNRLLTNLAVLSKPPQRVLQQMEDDKMTPETDEQPSLFWLGSPANRVEGNVAVGGTFGIWLELRRKARGLSPKVMRNLTNINPSQWPMGRMGGNVVHSNMVGLSFYKNGYRAPGGGLLRWITSYKNVDTGLRLHASSNIIVDECFVSDAHDCIDFSAQNNCTVQNSVVMAVTDNVGNPVDCIDNRSHFCVPIDLSCGANFTYRNKSLGGEGYRTLSRILLTRPLIGINLAANYVINTTFSWFNSSGCHKGGAMGWLEAADESRARCGGAF